MSSVNDASLQQQQDSQKLKAIDRNLVKICRKQAVMTDSERYYRNSHEQVPKAVLRWFNPKRQTEIRRYNRNLKLYGS